mgnify:CR=1 FL=1
MSSPQVMSDHAHTIRFGVAQAHHSTVPAAECVTHNDGCEFAAWVDADGPVPRTHGGCGWRWVVTDE